MNCPKCGCDDMRPMIGRGMIGRVMVCMNCDWNSDTLEALVLASPSYRLAQLEAKGAEPGWYGPDGVRWSMMGSFGTVFLSKDGQDIDFAFARLCGFVEVKA